MKIMTDFKNNKYLSAMLAWGLLCWAFLAYKFWGWIFRFAIFEFENFGSEFSVTKNRSGNFGQHKPSMMDWEAPDGVLEFSHEETEAHVAKLLEEQVPKDGLVQMLHSGYKPQHYDTTDIRMVVRKNRRGKGRTW